MNALQEQKVRYTETIKGNVYEVWYSSFNECWMLVRNGLTILDAGDKQEMLSKLNKLKKSL